MQGLNHPALRDLYWAVASQPLLDSPYNTQLKLSLNDPWLQQLAQQPKPLLEFLQANPQKRLGLYFENLWAFFLQQHPQTDLIKRNLQVFANKNTVGEFDFIYYCKRRDCHVHLEVAVKYYLGVKQALSVTDDPMQQWIGPQCVDRLDIKYQRLLQHQLQLSKHPAAKQQLTQLGIKGLHIELHMPGVLFPPWQQQLGLPVSCSTDVNTGCWLPLRESSSLLALHPGWMILPKLQWLAPVQLEHVMDAEAVTNKLEQHFKHSKRPLMLCNCEQQGLDYWVSEQRYFITPNDWPYLG